MTISVKPIRNYPFRGKIYTARQIDEILNGSILTDYYTKTETDNKLADKQDKLTAGDNITISDENVISATIPVSDFVKLNSTDWSSVITIDDNGNYIANKDILIVAHDATPHKVMVLGYYPKGFDFDNKSGTGTKGANTILVYRVEPWYDGSSYICYCYAKVSKVFSATQLTYSDVNMYGLYLKYNSSNGTIDIRFVNGESYFASQNWKNDSIELWYKG